MGSHDMANSFYVVGGEYADTNFKKIAAGKTEERYGPYATEKEAHDQWRALTGKTVDNAMVRYFIRGEQDDQGEHYYVHGGEYADTSFTKIAAGASHEKYGPFTKQEAIIFWRGITAKTVDNAMMRYDIATEAELADRA